MFIFDRCCRSSAAVTPAKYECDANNLKGTFARSKTLLTEKLTNGALVTPTPVQPYHGAVVVWYLHSIIILLWEAMMLMQSWHAVQFLYIIMVGADALVPNRFQDIIDHHVHSTVTITSLESSQSYGHLISYGISYTGKTNFVLKQGPIGFLSLAKFVSPLL